MELFIHRVSALQEIRSTSVEGAGGELRDLIRGIHLTILSNLGLDTAISAPTGRPSFSLPLLQKAVDTLAKRPWAAVP
jgi:hypothetical protein